MKRISAIIKPYKVDDVKNALKEIGITGLTKSNVEGFGKQGGHKEIYRSKEYNVAFVCKTKIELVVADSIVDKVIDVIIKNARTGEIGDGKIFVSPVERAIRIRTGEEGNSAL
ncbi:MAG: P-II family nitrogen regulator [Endomicrobiaceae bacterium]|nr:P-II family nitrogen regulator [Endomicrobiaceae bacterium]